MNRSYSTFMDSLNLKWLAYSNFNETEWPSIENAVCVMPLLICPFKGFAFHRFYAVDWRVPVLIWIIYKGFQPTATIPTLSPKVAVTLLKTLLCRYNK